MLPYSHLTIDQKINLKTWLVGWGWDFTKPALMRYIRSLGSLAITEIYTRRPCGVKATGKVGSKYERLG